MSTPPFEAGDWVWCKFPTHENPVEPGLTHITYTMAVTGLPDGRHFAVVAYSTSQIPKKPWPDGLLYFGEQQAARMGHTKPFMLNPARIAAVPINSAYFPYLDQLDHGVIGRASEGVQGAITKAFKEIATKRREVLEQLGSSWDQFR